MGQPGMRITVDAAMRARDVSRPRAEGEEPPANAAGAPKNAESTKPTKPPKGERRRLGKRGAPPRRT
ncbi:hypothetical protein [Actinomadura rudentiformis]|uniref:Uncharacterized protein n=1 Tax=Actinomadura rudentiformis TaxID=359158 RepID=A0A6H9YKB4_9ACTN|nr:hypothetical protein [Actinomadura rudentiformis]KAB2347475.1 hypothetical protein F8566_21000 [Actinomadura rudentiformis]